MKSALDEVTRFATLVTRNPTVDDLLATLKRDFLSEEEVSAIEVQVIDPASKLVLRYFIGTPIDGSSQKSTASISELLADENIHSDLEKSGSIYNPHNHITLTITAKDSAGNLTWDGAELGNSSTAAKATANAVSIAGGPLTQVGSIASTDSFTSGVKKYKFTVGGISSGSFQLVVDLPALNSTTYKQSAQTVAYKVTAAADGGVSNADVLKAIVSLIASINKQIAALQKALLKK